MDFTITKYNATTGKRRLPSPPPSNIHNKKRKTTQADAERYAQPAIKVFFCDDEKEDIPGIIRKFCPLAQLTDISQLKGNEMLSSAKASSPSLLYLSPNIRFPVLDFVRNLVPVLPEQWNKRPAASFQGPVTSRVYHSTGIVDTILSQVTKESVVGIFSRSAKSNYKWLKGLLEPRVKRVESNYISSNNMKFREATRKCNFGILYHTSTSGRINITDVMDSLYDEELKHMSAELDRKNVVVLVDDLSNNSDQERRKILQCQPSIERYAKDLILMSKTEKMAIFSGEVSNIKKKTMWPSSK